MENTKVRKKSSNQGFTLLEVLVAIVVLSIGILSVYTMQIATVNTNASANNLTAAANWANDRIEILLSSPYDCSPVRPNCHDLDDVNGDGTNQDTNGDGVDDVLPDTTFGLDNATPATADGMATSPDGMYTILWNVAVDTPVPNTKTVRVIVTSQFRGMTKTVPITYIKSDS